MKTLDVHALHEGIQHTIEKLDKQKQQLEKLEKSVEHLAGMKDALKGKGGDAIRTFYEECHKPFLLFFGMFIDEYKKVLKQTQHAISSVESDSHGMIAEAFLSHDARHGIKHAREVTEQLTDAVNRQTSAIDHIVNLPTVKDSFFRMETEEAERLISDTLNKLFQFDGQQTNALETAKSDFQTMKKYIDQLETMYTGPRIEITGYKSGSILKSQEEENINQTFGAINPQMKQPDDSPMEMMLKKLEKHKQSNVDSVMMNDEQQKIGREIYGDDSNLTVLQKEAAKISLKVAGDIRVINGKLYNVKGWKVVQRVDVADETVRDQADINYIGGVYSIYENGQIVRRYLKNGKPSIEIVEKIPEGRSVGGVKNIDEEVPGLGKITDTIGEFFVVNDGIRATTGEDPKTNKKVSVDERILSTLFIIPIAKIGKYVFVWSKGEKALKRVPSVEKEIGKINIPYKFANRNKLEGHFKKHGNEFKGIYKNAEQYLKGAQYIVNNGTKVQYRYKLKDGTIEIRTGYVKFMGTTRKGAAKFEFVGTNNQGYITTYHVESDKDFWKMLNGDKHMKVINPIH
ncbi:T7SS effector LXG polymorphic toxin [Bacillus sp. FSL R5-0560]|uniref:T7SS effector LXG polymorphic toxin n=1 Tax=Bacillus mojavensis TaxID=72360 RepID=A0AAP3CNP7_BACMO|nr:T7SS effector LXG polymorphic toxin [Bacillus mojavensis]MCY8508532.1 T7SS effector LXG polymorphic toxin [Bacillus mojavensis]MCY9187737.1 T7SS effector LXG polymorphic toxin [Bacillus mojavensis]